MVPDAGTAKDLGQQVGDGDGRVRERERRYALIGTEVGSYKIMSTLGVGGMGSVYLGIHPLIGKRVAIKILHAEFAEKQDVIGRFFNEAGARRDSRADSPGTTQTSGSGSDSSSSATGIWDRTSQPGPNARVRTRTTRRMAAA